MSFFRAFVASAAFIIAGTAHASEPCHLGRGSPQLHYDLTLEQCAEARKQWQTDWAHAWNTSGVTGIWADTNRSVQRMQQELHGIILIVADGPNRDNLSRMAEDAAAVRAEMDALASRIERTLETFNDLIGSARADLDEMLDRFALENNPPPVMPRPRMRGDDFAEQVGMPGGSIFGNLIIEPTRAFVTRRGDSLILTGLNQAFDSYDLAVGLNEDAVIDRHVVSTHTLGDDDSYLSWGAWARQVDGPRLYGSFFRFAGGNFPADNIRPVTGTATYRGEAAGMAQKNEHRTWQSPFTDAPIRLSANFDMNAVFGEIDMRDRSVFREGGVPDDMPSIIHFPRTRINDDGTWVRRTGDHERDVAINARTRDGRWVRAVNDLTDGSKSFWQGRFYSPQGGNVAPDHAGGVFSVNYLAQDGEAIRVDGSFGAEKN